MVGSTTGNENACDTHSNHSNWAASRYKPRRISARGDEESKRTSEIEVPYVDKTLSASWKDNVSPTQLICLIRASEDKVLWHKSKAIDVITKSLFPCGLETSHLTQCVIEPHKSTRKMASECAERFKQGARLNVTGKRQSDHARYEKKCVQEKTESLPLL